MEADNDLLGRAFEDWQENDQIVKPIEGGRVMEYARPRSRAVVFTIIVLLVILGGVVIWHLPILVPQPTPVVDPTRTPTLTATATASATATEAVEAMPMATPVPTEEPTQEPPTEVPPTATQQPTDTQTPTATLTATQTATATHTPTVTPTQTPKPTSSPSPTATLQPCISAGQDAKLYQSGERFGFLLCVDGEWVPFQG